MMPSAVLDAARRAVRGGDLAGADALYRQCLRHGFAVHAEYAGVFYVRGDLARARQILDLGLAGGGDANLLFLRGLLARAEARHREAIADFESALAIDGSLMAARLNRGLALVALERIPEAIADIEQACRLVPGDADAWTQLGLLQLRQEDWNAAIASLDTAERLAPGRPAVLRSLAQALAATGHVDDALRLLERAETTTPRDPAVLTDHALALLRARQLDAALARCERALLGSPGDQTALALTYLLHIERGEHAAAQRLMDYTALLSRDNRGRSGDLDARLLRDAVLGHPDLAWEPVGRSTLKGQQTARLDLGQGSAFEGFGRMVERAVEVRMKELGADSGIAEHPWVRALPSRWKVQAWATVLHDGGRQRPHIHPAGWMSGVFYLDTGSPESAEDGCLVFGHPQDDLGITASPLEHTHRPACGEMLLFPSYFLHHTTAFHGARPRISLAFDVLPM